MKGRTSEIGILRAIFEIFGIVLVRFRPLQRSWGAWLVAVNSASIFFLGHIEARVALGAVGLAVVAQALIYQRKRFVRILGATHILWVPMLAWMALRLETLPAGNSNYRVWLVLLIATNMVSLAIDAFDTARFVLGERRPFYAW
jgi:hypothetical protein